VFLKLLFYPKRLSDNSFSSFNPEEFLENLGTDEIRFKNLQLHLDTIVNILRFSKYKKIHDGKAENNESVNDNNDK